MRILLLTAVLLLAAAPALAGPPKAAGCLDGFDCDNQCPLAHRANTHRALGDEAPRVSAVVRADLAKKVAANLARI